MELLRQHVEQPSSTAWQPIAPKSAFHQPEEKGQLLFQRVQAENEWNAKLKAYIDQVPIAERWSKSITIPSLSILDLILKTKELTVPVRTLNEGFQQSSTITSNVKHYYLLTEYAKANANQSRLVASFMDFLFCCVCHVACCLGASEQDVNSKMRRISRGKPAYLQEVRQGVAWQVNATDQLQIIGGWGIRSGDIVFHFPPTFKLLRLCVKRKMSIDLYINSLENKIYTKGKENDPGMALSIPCILKCLFGSAARLDLICLACNCNYEVARATFTNRYLERYGQYAMDDDEKRSLCFPLGRALSTPSEVSTRSDCGYGSTQHDHDRPSKRRRIHKADMPSSGGLCSRLEESPSIQGREATFQVGFEVSVADRHEHDSSGVRQDVSQPFTSTILPLLSPEHSQEPGKFSQRSHSDHLSLYLGTTVETAESEKIRMVPSFTPVSDIASVLSTNHPQTEGLPSSPLNSYLPSFSQITGIPSPCGSL